MHLSTQGRTWDRKTVAGGATSSAMVLPIEGIDGLGGAGKFRMGKGFAFKPHRHGDWLVITVLSGRLEVLHEGDTAPCVYEAGDVYVVAPGAVHRETALADSEVVVVYGPGVRGEHYETHTVSVGA